MEPVKGTAFLLLLCAAAASTAYGQEDVHQRPQLVLSKTPLRTNGGWLSAMYDGGDWIYLVGLDMSIPSSTISVYRYSISKDTTEKGGEWPSELGLTPPPHGGSAVLSRNGDVIYLGGGEPGPDGKTEIWRVNALNTTDKSLLGHLPYGLPSSSAVYDGSESVYLLGGYRPPDVQENEILKFSLGTNKVEIVGKLPMEMRSPNAVFDDQTQAVYLFGGSDYNGSLANILKFDTISGQVETLNVSLYQPTRDSCTVWTGTQAYIIGGVGPDLQYGVSRFTPDRNQLELLEVDNFPARMEMHSCVYVEQMSRIYVFGGMITMDPPQPPPYARVMYIDLNPGLA